jgi:hypothetical protein
MSIPYVRRAGLLGRVLRRVVRGILGGPPGASLALGVVLALAGVGCGLISSDVTNFDLTLPDKKFTIDTGRWQVDSAQASSYLETSCSAQPTVCSTAVRAACPMACTGTCNAQATCDLSLNISLLKEVNLVAEKPELASINDEPVIKVTVDSVTYAVTSNSLSVDTPEITVYVAPVSTLRVDPADPQVKAIGTIAPVAAGWVTEQPEPIRFTATGRADLVKIMSSFKTPFNVFLGGSLLVTQGQAVPTGQLDAVVFIKGHAGL